jgi:CSLREA domain-containing protein
MKNQIKRRVGRVINLSVGAAMLLGLLSLQSASALPGSPHTLITVNTTADEFDTGSSCSLREAIQTANQGSNFGGCVMSGSGALAINIPAGTYILNRVGSGEDGNASGDLDLRTAMTLYGAGSGATIIQAQAGLNDRVFHIVQDAASDYVVTIWDLSITGGHPGEGYDGGGVLNEESLWISRVSIHQNVSQQNGGGVASFPQHADQGFSAYLSSAITDNTAEYNLGGGIVVAAGYLLLDHVEISNNSASGGGGIFLSGETATITWSDINNNYGMGGGGGLSIGAGDLILEDSSLTGNLTDADGGNLFLWTDPAGSIEITRCYIGGGQALAGVGAGIYNASNLTLSSSTIALNAAVHGAGFYQGPETESGRSISIYDSTIVHNNLAAPLDSLGNGLYNWQGNADIQLRNTIIAWNGNPGTTDFENCVTDLMIVRLVSLGHNLDSGDSCGFSQTGDLTDTDPLLGDLDFYGGFSLNYALDDLSPALESGGDCLSTDQRGYERPMDQNRDAVVLCDIGAVEAEPYFLPPLVWFPLILTP